MYRRRDGGSEVGIIERVVTSLVKYVTVSRVDTLTKRTVRGCHVHVTVQQVIT